MNPVEILTTRNAEFAAQDFVAGLPILPSLKTMIITCVDPRVDPAQILGLKLGEAVVIRNVAGRITPATLQELEMLLAIARGDGSRPKISFTLIVLQHTDCGITRLAGKPDMLAEYFAVSKDELAAEAVMDPHAAVAVDVAALRAYQGLPADWIVSGLVYDVATGLVETIVPATPLREVSA